MSVEKEIRDVWISRYALHTKGVYKTKVVLLPGGVASVLSKDHCRPTQHFLYDGEWHDTEKEALEKAEKLRLKTILRLTKYLNKLKKKKFT